VKVHLKNPSEYFTRYHSLKDCYFLHLVKLVSTCSAEKVPYQKRGEKHHERIVEGLGVVENYSDHVFQAPGAICFLSVEGRRLAVNLDVDVCVSYRKNVCKNFSSPLLKTIIDGGVTWRVH